MKFQTSSHLQQATLSFIASNLTTSNEIMELKNAFVLLDENGDGHLTVTELKNGFSTLSLSSAIDIDKILDNCDVDFNGILDYNEFITATIDWGKHLSHGLLESAFKAFDKDKSGTISLHEIRDFLGAGDDALTSLWKKTLDEADSNGDGVIDLDEFKALMLKTIG